MKWIANEGDERDVVVSSRVRLARNLKEWYFPSRMTPLQGSEVYEKIVNSANYGETNAFKMKDIPKIEQHMLVEKHVISPTLLMNQEISGFIMNKDETETIMINEEDHIRIQVLTAGLSLQQSYLKANQIDDFLESHLNYAFDEKLGFLTACPTNLGTGLRASVMLHLPALEMTKEINQLITMLNQFGLAVRGVYGEGTKALGSLYQLSNQSTLGDKEEGIVQKIEQLCRQIAAKEKDSRKKLLENNGVYFEDKIYRAYGLLKHTRTISAEEAVKLISLVKLGINLGLIENNTIELMDQLFVQIQPANIQYLSRQEMTSDERDVKRAQILRERIK